MKFGDLQFTENDTIDVDVESMPEEFGNRTPPPQPGSGYVVELPAISLDDEGWSVEESENEGSYPVYTFDPRAQSKDEEGNEIDRTPNGLKLLSGPDPNLSEGQEIRVRLSARPRTFTDRGGVQQKVSQMAYLIRAILGPVSLKNAIEYADALVQCGGKRVKVDIDWTARCAPDRAKYGIDPDTGEAGVMEGEVGCGQRYGTRARTIKGGAAAGEKILQVPKVGVDADGRPVPEDDDGNVDQSLVVRKAFSSRFLCATDDCNALINPFLDIRNFQNPEGKAAKPASKQEQKKAVTPAKPGPKVVAKPAAAPVKSAPVAAKKPVPVVRKK